MEFLFGQAVDFATRRDEYRFVISKEQLLLLTDNLPLTGQNEICAFGIMDKVHNLVYNIR